jgi:hypothetical protein
MSIQSNKRLVTVEERKEASNNVKENAIKRENHIEEE